MASLTSDQLDDFFNDVEPSSLDTGIYGRCEYDFSCDLLDYGAEAGYVVLTISFTDYNNIIQAIGYKVQGDDGLEELEYHGFTSIRS